MFSRIQDSEVTKCETSGRQGKNPQTNRENAKSIQTEKPGYVQI